MKLNEIKLRMELCIGEAGWYLSGGGSISRTALSTSDSTPLKFNSEEGKLRSSQLGVNLTDSGPVSRNVRASGTSEPIRQMYEKKSIILASICNGWQIFSINGSLL